MELNARVVALETAVLALAKEHPFYGNQFKKVTSTSPSPPPVELGEPTPPIMKPKPATQIAWLPRSRMRIAKKHKRRKVRYD
jgi:hypothetical protein